MKLSGLILVASFGLAVEIHPWWTAKGGSFK